ncbi:MAG: dTMP kinase [Olsenella sp.]|jgi:dTMP kinase|nr:dTMP kinase [Olsenella sp.]MCI1288236.1 dTMP kinase [Olsenella sp.]
MAADAAAHAPARRGGTFLSLEGVDGCGKSTQARALAERLRAAGLDVVSVREPGGTALGEKIRGILLDPANGAMCDECELLLYEASRAQLVREVIEPALARGAVVVCDRYLDSTFAYQAGGRGLDAGLVRSCNALGSCGVLPDRTLVLDMPAREGLGRAVGASGGADRIEAAGLAFQQRVRDAYLGLAQEDPARVRVVDASGTPDEVARRVDEALAGLGLPVGEGVRHG